MWRPALHGEPTPKEKQKKSKQIAIGSESTLSGLHLILEDCKTCNDLAATLDFAQITLSLRAYLQGHPGRRKRDPVCKPTMTSMRVHQQNLMRDTIIN